MTLLRDVCPEDFLRAGAVFGQVAEQVSGASSQARHSAEVRWVGRPHQQYQQQLGGLVRDLTRIQRAYDDACDALFAYSRALGAVRDLALQADLIAAQAEDMHQARDLDLGMNVFYAPITLAEQALVDRARLLRIEAEDQEQVASARLAATLRALADDAPHLSCWTSMSRFVADAAQGAGDQVKGVADLAEDAFLSIPMVGDARSRAASRKQLREAAASMAQPWLAIEDLLQELHDGEYGYASGSLAGALVLRKAGARGKKLDIFGAHDDMHLGVLGAVRRAGAGADLAATERWVAQHAQREFLDELTRLQHVPLPPVDDLIANGADLMLQEAHGGHTLLRHVGRDVEFLRWRQVQETAKAGPTGKSTFVHIDEAERVVAQALASGAEDLRSWANGSKPSYTLRMPLPSSAGLLVNGLGDAADAEVAVLRLAHAQDGSIRIVTAYVELENR
ncbi:MAG: hypothetical protein JWM02_3353 [Frankiales bacterium]|nr:hypothetical protein [Frankiales bacterium]